MTEPQIHPNARVGVVPLCAHGDDADACQLQHAGLVRPLSEEPMSRRDHAIRAIHQYADWLTNHPEVDTPDLVSAYKYLYERAGGPSEGERVDYVLDFAKEQSVKASERSGSVSAELPVVRNVHVTVEHSVVAFFDERPRRRYLP